MPPYKPWMVSAMAPQGELRADEYSAITQRKNAAMRNALAVAQMEDARQRQQQNLEIEREKMEADRERYESGVASGEAWKEREWGRSEERYGVEQGRKDVAALRADALRTAQLDAIADRREQERFKRERDEAARERLVDRTPQPTDILRQEEMAKGLLRANLGMMTGIQPPEEGIRLQLRQIGPEAREAEWRKGLEAVEKGSSQQKMWEYEADRPIREDVEATRRALRQRQHEEVKEKERQEDRQHSIRVRKLQKEMLGMDRDEKIRVVGERIRIANARESLLKDLTPRQRKEIVTTRKLQEAMPEIALLPEEKQREILKSLGLIKRWEEMGPRDRLRATREMAASSDTELELVLLKEALSEQSAAIGEFRKMSTETRQEIRSVAKGFLQAWSELDPVRQAALAYRIHSSGPNNPADLEFLLPGISEIEDKERRSDVMGIARQEILSVMGISTKRIKDAHVGKAVLGWTKKLWLRAKEMNADLEIILTDMVPGYGGFSAKKKAETIDEYFKKRKGYEDERRGYDLPKTAVSPGKPGWSSTWDKPMPGARGPSQGRPQGRPQGEVGRPDIPAPSVLGAAPGPPPQLPQPQPEAPPRSPFKDKGFFGRLELREEIKRRMQEELMRQWRR